MREGMPSRRDAAVTLTLAALLLLVVGTVVGVIAEIAGRVVLAWTIEDLVSRGGRTLSLAPAFWTRLLVAEAGVQVGAVVAGYLVAHRLLNAGDDPGRRLYLFAVAPPLGLAVVSVGVRVVAGGAAADVTLSLVIEVAGVAGALLGCWWACRRWQSAAGPLWRT